MNEEKKEKIRKATSELVKATNSFIDTKEEIAVEMIAALISEHRTLQQNFIGVIIQLIVQYGQLEDRYFDGRNEASQRLCEKITKFIEKDGYYLPLI